MFEAWLLVKLVVEERALKIRQRERYRATGSIRSLEKTT
jgi:hypothetical protein